MIAMGILPTFLSAVEEIQDTIIEKSEDNLAKKRTFKFDFQAGEFQTDAAGNVLMTSTSEELLKQTVDKILHDSRFKYLIYSDDHGNEVDYILAQDDPPEIVEMELKRVYTEALIYHPLISGVSDFSFEHDGDAMYCDFIVEGKYGDSIPYREEVEDWSRRR